MCFSPFSSAHFKSALHLREKKAMEILNIHRNTPKRILQQGKHTFTVPQERVTSLLRRCAKFTASQIQQKPKKEKEKKKQTEQKPFVL